MSRNVVVAAAALGLTVVGGVVGAAVYASARPASTTTVVNTIAGAGPGVAGQPIAATSGLTATEIFRNTYRGVVDIKVALRSAFSLGRAGSQRTGAEGSGFVYDGKGDIVTNQHVVDGATAISVRFWNGDTYAGHIVATDPSSDLAVVKVSAPASVLHPLRLGNSDLVQVGDGVVAIGSPFGLAESMTSGIVSALHRGITGPSGYTIPDTIQTDAPINHGNSGGPLLDSSGRVIGVNTQIQTDSGGSNGVGFALPSNTIARVAPTLLARKPVVYAYLGVRIADASTPTDLTAGALAGNVTPGTPAARAGLRSGDVIVRANTTTISSAEELSAMLETKQPGDKLAVTYMRDGKSHTVTITLGRRP
jgi:putative serine protease PepD